MSFKKIATSTLAHLFFDDGFPHLLYGSNTKRKTHILIESSQN
jgi:hypothetical protein